MTSALGGGGMDIVQAAHEIRQDQLEFTKILGSGTFGTVFKVFWETSLIFTPKGLYKEERVAIKVLNESTQARTEFKKEYDIMR